MTAKEAIEQADALRPNNPYSAQCKQQWLRQADGSIRYSCIERSCTCEYDNRGADLADRDDDISDVMLLLPEPYDGAYVHWLCAQIDLALGEADRYANEAQQYNTEVQAFAARMRRLYRPVSKPRLRY